MAEVHETCEGIHGPIHIDSWDDGIEYRIEVAGHRTVFFDWSDRFGPLFVTNRRLERKTQLKHPDVWNAIQWWFDQGKRHQDGLCIWEPVEIELERLKRTAVPLGGGHYLVVNQGE